jgi:hypothetical protein
VRREAHHPVPLRRHTDDRGALIIADGEAALPFAARRMYAITDVPSGRVRGAHAHRALRQVFAVLAGAFTLRLDDGDGEVVVRMNDPARGHFVGPMVWRELDDFAPGTVCLVLASDPYDADDYLHTKADFLRALAAKTAAGVRAA